MPPDPTGPFDELTAVTAHPGGVRATIPDTWQQGRGAFGGLVCAVMTRALETVAAGRALRSLTATLCGPTQPGDVELAVTPLRVGNAVTSAAVQLVQAGEVQAHAVGVFGAARAHSEASRALSPPEYPSWRECAAMPVLPLMPAFLQHLEVRLTGSAPFASGREPRVSGWVRVRNPGVHRDAALLCALVDSYWPALFSTMSAPRPMATIAFTMQPFASFDGLDPDAPYAYRAHQIACDAGYVVEQRELWGSDGRLLALNQQTFVIIK